MTNSTKRSVIVVGVDYSESGDLALAQAIDLATQRPGAEVHAVSVMRLVLQPVGGSIQFPMPASAAGITFDDASALLERHLATVLEKVKAARGGSFQSPRIVPHLRLESPAEEIAQLAADLEADLVVVGTHGRRGVPRLLLGSVAEHVVRLAPCPVLVVRSKGIVPAITIQPACSECLKTREASDNARFWCDQHSERHGQRHTYHGTDRVSKDGAMPLVFHG